MTTPAALTAASAGEVLAVEGVCVRLAGREILHDVSCTVARGEFVGLIGSNGAGKTTLLRVILGLQAPATGKVTVAGQQRSAGPRTRWRSGQRWSVPLRRSGGPQPPGRIGYVPQKILLDPDLPVRARDLVALGLDGHRPGLPLPTRRRRELTDAMLAAVGASRFADERAGNLSGGEQQRVLIAHALIGSPDLLLLDEPLANLDLRSEQEIIELLASVARKRRVAVLMSAHDMNPLLPVMDRLIYLADGRAASGPTAEVVRPDVLSALYGQHVDVITVHDRVLVVAGRDAAGADGHASVQYSSAAPSPARPGPGGGAVEVSSAWPGHEEQE